MADKLCPDCAKDRHSVCINKVWGVSTTCTCPQSNCQKIAYVPKEVKK